MFFAILPMIGAWIVWLPVSIWLISSGQVTSGIILLLYGAIIVSWIDNVLRSYIVSRKTNLSSGIVFIGMIGGIIVFGTIGLLLGPLILAYLIVLLDAYKNKQFGKLFN
jgi:predicted PurR-regulated permease PerM